MCDEPKGKELQNAFMTIENNNYFLFSLSSLVVGYT